MTELQIQYFMETAKCLNMTRVANKFYVSQPAVSMQIINLEQELGCTLFYRSKSAIALTDAGKIYYDFFLKTAQMMDNCREAARQMQPVEKNLIRLALMDGWCIEDYLTQVIGRFNQDYPDVEVSLECHGFKGIVKGLVDNQVDMILDLNKVRLNSQYFETRIVGRLKRSLEFSRMYRGRHDTLADFRNETFFVVSDAEVSSSIISVNKCCEPYGFSPNIHIVPNIPSQTICVQNNKGVALVDAWTDRNNKALDFLDLDHEAHQVRLSWRKNCQYYVKAFTEYFTEFS